jgi:ParB-like chromosome segregation protein Spo0J
MSPKQAIAMMAKGQKKTVKQIVDRRVAQGAEEKVKDIVTDMSSGIKYDIPMVTISNGGFTQDGYHRLMAADSLGIKQVPILVVRR